MRRCAACGCEVDGHFAVHRDGFCEGPEVDLCDACGSGEFPTLDEIWAMIATRRRLGMLEVGHA